MSKLRIGTDGFGLKAETFEDVVAILGRRGRGKTTTATVIVEGLHDSGARFVVADPVGVWWGLRSSRDGKRPGIPVIVMGGDHGDVPLASESGELIADFPRGKVLTCYMEDAPEGEREVSMAAGAWAAAELEPAVIGSTEI